MFYADLHDSTYVVVNASTGEVVASGFDSLADANDAAYARNQA